MFVGRISFRYSKRASGAGGLHRDENRFSGREAVGDLGVEPGLDRRARARPVQRPDRPASRSPTTSGCCSPASSRTPAQRRVLDATLVAIAEHGLVPSVQARRMTLAAAPDALQGAVAAGILGCGSVILGASETAGRLFAEIHRRPASAGGVARPLRPQLVEALRAAGAAVPGYGHPLHKARDPRVARAVRVSQQAGVAASASSTIAEAVESRCFPRSSARPCKLNVSAAIPAVLLGAGFPLARAEGRADPGAHREPDRAPDRGAGAPERLRAVVPGHARADPTTARPRRIRRRADDWSTSLHGRARARARHVHHRARRRRCCSPTSAPTWSRSSSPRATRSAPSRRPLQPALPDLQPQQAQHRARPQAPTPIAQLFDRLVAEADVYIQNFRPGAAERLGAGEARCASSTRG